jgi:hypothetical protein
MKEYEAHIRNPFAEMEHLSICGENIRHEFHFTSIDHAYCNNVNKGRLVPCLKCMVIVVNALSK